MYADIPRVTKEASNRSMYEITILKQIITLFVLKAACGVVGSASCIQCTQYVNYGVNSLLGIFRERFSNSNINIILNKLTLCSSIVRTLSTTLSIK